MATTSTPKEQVQKDTQQQAATPKLFGRGTIANKYLSATAQGIKYERTAFMQDTPPGLTETTNGNRNRTEKVATNVVEFSPQLVEGIKLPIAAHFDQIVALQNMEITDPATGKTIKAYDRIRDEGMKNNDPTFMLEQSMLALITTDGKVDKEKINKLAGDPRFMEAAMRILMRRKRDIFEAVGVREVINPRGNRANLLNTGRTITLGVDQGRVNDVARQFGQWWGDPLHVAGRGTQLTHGQLVGVTAGGLAAGVPLAAGIGAGAGAMVGAGIGAAFGGVGIVPGAIIGSKIGAAAAEVAAGVGAAVAISGSRSGLRVNFERRQDLLSAARGRASVRDEYLYGIDPNDFVLTADGRGIRIDPRRTLPGQSIHTTNLEGSFQQAIEILALQQMYAEALHIDPRKFESETQYIHEPKADFAQGSAPQTGEKMATDIHREYTTLLKLAQDKAHDAGTNLNEASFDVRSRLFNQAEATVIQRRLEAIMKEPVKTQETRRSENLDKKAASFTKGSPEFDTRTKKDTEGKARAEKDKQVYTDEGQKLTAYQTELDAVTKQREDLQKKLTEISTTGTGFPDVASATSAINALLNYDPASGTVPDKVSAYDEKAKERVEIEAIKVQIATADTAHAAALGALTGAKEQKEAQKQAADRDYNEAIAKINHQRDLLIALRDVDLNAAQKAINTAEAATATSPTSTEGRTTLENFSHDYDRLRRFGITEARLKGDDVDAIMRDINRAAGRGDPNAWDATGNTVEANRAIVLNAMAEQRTKDILSRSINRATQEPIFADALVLGITEHQLKVSSPEELEKLYRILAPEALRVARDTHTVRFREERSAFKRLNDARADKASASTDIARLGAIVRSLARTDPTRPTALADLRAASDRFRLASDTEATALSEWTQADSIRKATLDRLSAVREAESRLRLRPATSATRTRPAISARPAITVADLTSAKAWAYERLSAHQEALSNRTGEIDRDITTLDRRINAVDASLESAREQVARTKEIVTQWENGDLQSRVTSIMFEADERNKLLDTTNTGNSTSTEPLTQAQGYTEAEISSNLTRGELALINMITGYQKPEADRAKRFAEVQKLFDVATNRGNFQALVEAFETFVPTGGTPTITVPISTPHDPYAPQRFAANAMTTRTGFTWRTPANVKELLTVVSPLIEDRNFDSFEMYRIIGLFTTKMYQSTMAV